MAASATRLPVRLVLLDAFGTLLRPRIAPHLQYAEEARKLGIRVDEARLGVAFKQAFKNLSRSNPAYVPMGPDAWWLSLIEQSFNNALDASPSSSSSSSLPQSVLDELGSRILSRFSTSEAYELYADVKPTLTALHELQQARRAKKEDLHVVLASNSDARIVSALQELLASQDTLVFEGLEGRAQMAWDLKVMKPDRAFFRRALARSWPAVPFQQTTLTGTEGEGTAWDERAAATVMVGDVWKEDWEGSVKAGLQGVWINREGHGERARGEIRDLRELMDVLE